ncbi:TfuA-like protein [Actinoplanes sp. NPDC051859]|uniref:TfuA-like protein n=1 Tax=Actinoplanes sp. NPDC051859 TaxID=3363909 RepID=UPI00379319AA
MNTKTVVYTGPTLTADRVREVLPGAQIRPPAGRGDLLAEDWRAGDVAVIIDGYFRERRSVGHKEILWLLHAGVRVVGAGSMGALRAAELSAYGMCGVGAVYAMYASGEIDGDDEVGVLHGPADRGFPAFTVALVNLRYAGRLALEAGTVSAGSVNRLVAAAKALPFTHRTWADITRGAFDAAALAAGTAAAPALAAGTAEAPALAAGTAAADRAVGDAAAADLLRELIDAGVGNAKQADACAALAAVAAGDLPATPPVPMVFTGISRDQVAARRTRREYAPGRTMSDFDVLDAARLFDDSYPALHEQVLTGLLAELAAPQGLTVAEYARAKLGIDGRDRLPDALAAWLTDAECAGLLPEQRLLTIMVRVWPVWHSADWRPAVLDRLRSSADWSRWSDIVERAGEESPQRIVVPPPALCASMFLRHWREPHVSPAIAMARRGFTDAEQLGAAVRPFFAFDVRRSRSTEIAV